MTSRDSLINLITEACIASPRFAFKWNYRTKVRPKPVTTEWLFEQLVDALGEETVIQALEEINQTKYNGTVKESPHDDEVEKLMRSLGND